MTQTTLDGSPVLKSVWKKSKARMHQERRKRAKDERTRVG